MRASEIEFLNVCYDVKVFLAVSKFELAMYEDGSYADFYVNLLKDCLGLCHILNGFAFNLTAEDSRIKIRVFENYSE